MTSPKFTSKLAALAVFALVMEITPASGTAT